MAATAMVTGGGWRRGSEGGRGWGQWQRRWRREAGGGADMWARGDRVGGGGDGHGRQDGRRPPPVARRRRFAIPSPPLKSGWEEAAGDGAKEVAVVGWEEAIGVGTAAAFCVPLPSSQIRMGGAGGATVAAKEVSDGNGGEARQQTQRWGVLVIADPAVGRLGGNGSAGGGNDNEDTVENLEKMMACFDEIWGDLPMKIDQVNESMVAQKHKALFQKEVEQHGNDGFTSELYRMVYDLGYEVPPKYTKVSTHVGNQSHYKATVTLVSDKEDLPQLSFSGEDHLNSTVYHCHLKHGDDFWMNGCANTWDEENQTIVHMRTMLPALDHLHSDYKTQAIIQKHAQQEKIARLQKLVEQMRDKSQPKDSNTAKILEYTEARFAQYRKDTNWKLVFRQKRIFELENELRKLKGEPSSDEDEDMKPTRDAKRLYSRVLSLKINTVKKSRMRRLQVQRKIEDVSRIYGRT
uniref:Uncharacterized protein n=1 Tax=Oryza punctata TaxID=4537 RepID=A0A0E0LBZ5_ORYPU